MSVQKSIIKHLDLWTSARKTRSIAGRGSNNKLDLVGIRKLRELILELAVRGKLVPQDANDESATELLKKIAAEKSILISAGKIRKEKSLLHISSADIPSDIPQSWAVIKLGVVSTKLTDGSHNPPADAGEGLPMLSSQNVNFGIVDFSNPSRFVTAEDFERENARTLVESGDVLLTIVGTLGRAAVVPHQAPKFVLQRSVAVIKTGLSPHFLAIQFQAITCSNYFETHGKGTAQKGIYLGKLADMPLFIPPLAEQHRIVAKVDELMAFCDQLEQTHSNNIAAHAQIVEVLLATLINSADNNELQNHWQRIATHFDTLFTTEHSIDHLEQAILQLAVMGKLVPQNPSDEPASELLTKIIAEKARLVKEGKIKKEKPLPEITEEEKSFELPSGWERVRLASISDVGTGATPSRTNGLYYEPAEVNWVTSGETSEEYIRETKEKVSRKAVKETNISIYPVGTLIVAMYGQGKTRGQITELLIEAGTNQACAAVRLIENSAHHRKYIKLFFVKAYDELREQAAGGAQPNLNVGKVSAIVIPLPPLAEQYRIVAKVEEIMAFCDSIKTNIRNAQISQLALADALVNSALGPSNVIAKKIFEEAPMNISTSLKLLSHKTLSDKAPLAKIIKDEGGDADAKQVWKKSNLDLPNFYKQLKVEIAAGYIVKPSAGITG
ncbi:MAG: restriction endonuclease subunit S [Pseudomonadota bacterium]